MHTFNQAHAHCTRILLQISATAAVNPKCMLGKKTPDLQEHYNVGSLLGTGQFATTRVATNRQTGQKLACKSISKAKLPTPSHVADVGREIQIMQHLSGHPNVVTFHGVYEDRQHIHIIMELCEGGDLFDKIFAKGHYTEQDAARLIRAIMTVSILGCKVGVRVLGDGSSSSRYQMGGG